VAVKQEKLQQEQAAPPKANSLPTDVELSKTGRSFGELAPHNLA